MLGPVGETDAAQRLAGDREPAAALDPLVVQRQGDVLGGGLERDQVERLEDEPDPLAAVDGGPGLGDVLISVPSSR